MQYDDPEFYCQSCNAEDYLQQDVLDSAFQSDSKVEDQSNHQVGLY